MRTLIGALGLLALIASSCVIVISCTSVEPHNFSLNLNNGFAVVSVVTFGLFLLATTVSKIVMIFDFMDHGYNSIFETSFMAVVSLVLAVVTILLFMVASSQSAIVTVQTGHINSNSGFAAAIFLISTVGIDFLDCYTESFS